MPQVAGFVVGAFGFGAGSFAIGSAAFGGWAAGAAFASTALGGLAVNLLTTVSLSALQIALNKPRPSGGGITVSATLRGEQNPETIILGRTATAGQAICPPMSHGPANYYLTHVVELCSAPGATLDRLILGDEYVEIGESEHPDYGRPVLGDYEHFVWIKYYDGSQTAADPMLLDKYGDDPDRPWTSDMVGEGLCYAILTFKHHSSILPQVPTYRFEMTGIPVYDIRKDSSAGGLGSQRWHDPATWEQSLNPIVNLWNIWRGIRLPGGEIWGGDVSATALPSGNWISQMNKCDQLVALSEGDPEPRYRFGIEAALTEEPNAIAEELLKSASADIADMGGYWRVLVAEPDLPVYTFNDDDILVSSEQEYDPFPTIGETYNGVTASYPDPESLYEAKDAPGRYNADWEARDAFGRRTADLNLPAVPFGNQVQRLMQGWIDDERRFRRHVFSLPPDSAAVELLDTVGYTSARNGYDDKDFTVREITENLLTGVRKVSLREQDPADYLWSTDLELPDPPAPIGTSRVAVLVPGFDVQAVSIIGDDGAPRRPALRILWDPEVMADGVRWQIRLKDQPSEIVTGASLDIEAGNATVSDTILAATTYQVQCRLVSRQLSDWTAWIDVTTPDVRLSARDLDDTINDAITGANERANDAFDLHFVELPEADGVVCELYVSIYGEDGALTPVPLVAQLAQAYGPLFAPLPLAERVELAYGPLDVEVSVSDRLDIAVARLDFEIPQIRSASGSVDELFELLIGLQGQVGDVQRTMARAGIRVLEDQGRVEIAALAAANARLGEVGLTLDALSGQISQRATVAYVNEAISNAVLDPTQIPVISDISLRLGSVETTLDAETGRIDHLASLFVVEDAEMSLVAVSSRLDAAEEALTQRVTSEDFDAEVERLNGVEQTLTTLGDVSELRQTVTATRGVLADQDALGEATIADLWANHLGRTTLRKAEAAGRRSLRAFVDENFAAEVQARDELSVQIGAAEARIVQEGQLRAEEALATGEILSQMQLDLENQDQSLQGTIETLDETTGRVKQTEEGLEAEAARTDFLGAAIRIQGSDAEDASELALAGMWDAVKTRADNRRQLAVSMRAINARVDEGLLAEATERAVLGVALDGAFASIAEEKVVRAEQDRVLGEQASQITARLGATEAAIVELNRVELGSKSALVQSLLKLSGDVEDPDTGLAQAHGEIIQLNTVNLGSTSALVQAHLEVAGKVLDPETGVEANAQALETVTSSVEGQGEDLEALVQRADVLEAAVRSGQILPNGDFADGDLRGWEDIPATFLVRARQTGGPAALADAPTPYVLELAQDAAPLRAAAIKHVPVRADETFRASLVGAASTSGSALITLRFAFYGADGAYLSAVERNISLSGHAWALHQPADIQTPAGAQSAWIWLRRNAGGTGNVYVADLRVERFTSGQTEALAKIEELNTVNASSDAALVQAHLSLAGTVNDPATGLTKAHGLIAELNTVDVQSESAMVQAHLSLAGTVNDPATGLTKAHGLITELNTVDVQSESALVQAHLSLVGTVNDPETGLTKAHGLITELNTVDVQSESALVQAHLSLAGTVNDPETGLTKAHGLITELNTVDVQSESALVQAHLSLEATVNDPATGLTKAHGLITELNTVDVQSESALVQAHLSLVGTVNDPETGLTKAHGLITELNTVDVNSESALVQAHLSLAGTVNDPETGLSATGQIVEQQTVDLDKLGDELTVLTSRADVLEAAVRADQVLPNGDFAGGDMRGWADVPASFLVRPRQAGGPAALDAAPTPFVLELAHNLASQRAAAVKHVPVRGGEQFRASLQAAAAASGDAVLVVRMAFYGADGGYMSAVERNAWVAGHIWTLFDLGSITAPVGAQSAWIWLRRNAGGTGNAYATDIRVERVSSAQTEALARITNLEATRVTASGAVAAIETEISASFGNMTAMASATAFAKAQADKISAGYVWKLNGANIFEMVSVSDGTAGPVTTARIAADYIRLTGLSQISEAVIEELAVSNALVQNFTAAEASVGTLEIAGNAVTVPARAFRGELIEITSPTAWTTLVSLTIDRAGFATDLTFAAMLDGYGSGVVELGFWRDGVLIQTAHQATAPDGRQSHVSVTVSDFNLGTGQTVYSVTARKLDGTKTGGWNARMRLAKRRLNAIQYKR